MVTYIYFVKCPNCEDEHFDFFDEAKEFALGCLSQKPIITQTEVCRNDFGECTDSADLGTVWSWEDMMGEGGYTEAEPTKSIFTKDDLKLMANGKDPEFDSLDNSVDCEIDEISEKKPIEEDLISSYEYTHMTKEELYDRLVNKFEDVEIDVGDLGITDVPFYDGGRYSNSALVAMFEDDVFYVTMWHYSDDGEETESGSYDFETDSFEELWDELMSYKPEALVECSERKPIPEGMTIEELVEEMEENEDTVECTWCEELFDKSECRKEVDLGWLCSRCEMAIKSRGETLTFREGNYWDFLDEGLADALTEGLVDANDLGGFAHINAALGWLAKHVNKIRDKYGKEPSFLTKAFPELVKSNETGMTDTSKYSPGAKYVYTTSIPVAVHTGMRELETSLKFDVSRFEDEVKPRLFKKAANDFLSDAIDKAFSSIELTYNIKKLDDFAIRATYSGTPYEIIFTLTVTLSDKLGKNDVNYKPQRRESFNEATESHIRVCPECGKETFDLETGICVDCGFN